MMNRKMLFCWLSVAIVLVTLATHLAIADTMSGGLTFSNTPLLRPEGASEPAIWISGDGTVAVTALQWIFNPTPAFYGTHLWVGPFGSTPTFQGLLDATLQKSGKQVYGGADADVDIGSTGVLHATSVINLVNPTFYSAQLGVSAITCPSATSSLDSCTAQIIDTTGADRQWITSDGTTVYISYHDSGYSSLIHVQRSDDDGLNWYRVGDPVVGQGGFTGDATLNNQQGPIVADPFTHNVYAIYTAGEASVQKGTSSAFNNVIVSRSTDGGKSWTVNLVFHAPLFTDLSNTFPALAADPTSGKLYAVWSDGHQVFFSASSNQGATWTSAVAVNLAPATTALFPWVAAYGGTVDVVYYATTAASKDDPSAVWNVYLAQTLNDGASFLQSKVSNTSNHTGVICTTGAFCPPGTRDLLDLFEVAINPQNGRAGIAYTDDTITNTGGPPPFPYIPLPQIVLAQQNP